MTDERLEQLLTQNIIPEAPENKLNERLKAQMAETFADRERKEKQNMKKFGLKRTAVLVAAACMAFGAIGVASTGRAYVTGGSTPGEYTAFSELEKVEAKTGLDVRAVEKFANGYQFKEMSVMHEQDHTENGTVIGEYAGISIQYEKEGAYDLSLCMDDVEHAEGAEAREAVTQQEIDGLTLKYYLDTYKWVPAGYELTEEDKANLEKDNYFISEGVDEVSVNQVCCVIWEQDGVLYDLLCTKGEVPAEEMFAMAAEIIAQ